jgi:pimeloyl-ACP methyl ester carboxylesterase
MIGRRHIAICLGILTATSCRDVSEPLPPQIPSASYRSDDEPNVLTIDHQVPHVSTVPANAGEPIHLFVRERVRWTSNASQPRKAVLMVHGFSFPVLPGMALDRQSYDWALWLARSADLDVFMVDLQGSGRSPRTKMNDPCNVPTTQQALLVPNPLSATCPASYPFQLVTARSDWDELDTVIEYIRALRGVDKVALVGWSHGAARIGPYAAQHPDKVESLLFLAPFYNPAAPAGRPGTGPDGFGPPIDARTGLPFALPQPGTPLTLVTRTEFMTQWNTDVKCEDQVEDGIQDFVWNTVIDEDPIGRAWGTSDGVLRVRTFFLWGWNTATAGRITVPTLILHGTHDTRVPATFTQLYDALGAVPDDRRLLVEVSCAGHNIAWERQRKVLHHVSKEWLRHGAVGGNATGKFLIDAQGVMLPR